MKIKYLHQIFTVDKLKKVQDVGFCMIMRNMN